MTETEGYISFRKFIRACESQWRGGGKRYAHGKDKEWTDVITEILGNSWIGGQILKYAGEIGNSKRDEGVVPEVNFFKIAVYSFIWWLKEFKVKNTSVESKEKYWPVFVSGMESITLMEIVVGKEEFVSLIKALIHHPHIDFFYLTAMKAYLWWTQESENFTQRDKGEEFEK